MTNYSITYWSYIATVIDESCQVTALGCINDSVLVNPEQITASNTLIFIAPFTHVCYHLKVEL